jgi:hypothetical protein
VRRSTVYLIIVRDVVCNLLKPGGADHYRFGVSEADNRETQNISFENFMSILYLKVFLKHWLPMKFCKCNFSIFFGLAAAHSRIMLSLL